MWFFFLCQGYGKSSNIKQSSNMVLGIENRGVETNACVFVKDTTSRANLCHNSRYKKVIWTNNQTSSKIIAGDCILWICLLTRRNGNYLRKRMKSYHSHIVSNLPRPPPESPLSSRGDIKQKVFFYP